MQISARSVLMSGAATLTATAVALTPVQALPRDVTVSAPPAAAQQVSTQQLVDLLAVVQRLAANPSAAQLVAEPQATPTASLLAFPGLGNAIIGAYNAIEPWVAYGVDVADWALGWIPFGWIIGDQINIFYDSLEPAVQSIFYNIGWWVGGSISFWAGLNNVVLDSANAFIGLLNAEIRYGFGFLPPLPPGFPIPQIPYLPWFGVLQAQTAGLTADALAPEVGVQNAASNLVDAIYIPVRNTIDYGVDVVQDVLAPIPLIRIAGDQVSILWNSLAEPVADSVVFDLIDPVLNQPLNINSYINGVYDVGATTVNSLIDTGITELDYFFRVPFAAGQTTELNRTAEVSSVPPIVKNSLAPTNSPQGADEKGPAGPLKEVANTVRNVRNEIRSAVTERRSNDVADAGDNTVVRARGENEGPIAKAISGVRDAVRDGKPNTVASDAAKAPANAVKSIGDTARKVVKNVRQAAKDARNAAKDRAADE